MGMDKCMRGFATLRKNDPDKMRKIASDGGKAAHKKGTAHQWSSAEAREAGRLGGAANQRRRRAREAAADES